MKSIPIYTGSFLRSLIILLSICTASLLLSSCASQGVQKRTDRRNNIGGELDENMRIRQEAREERYHRSFDRLMEMD